MNDEDNNLNETNKYIPKHAYNNEINNFDRDNTYTNNDFYKVKNDVVLDENIYSDFDDNRDENIKVKSVKKKRKRKINKNVNENYKGRKVSKLFLLILIILTILIFIPGWPGIAPGVPRHGRGGSLHFSPAAAFGQR